VTGKRRGRTGRGWDAAPPRARSNADNGPVREAQIGGWPDGEDPARAMTGEATFDPSEDLELDEDGWPRGSVPVPNGRGRSGARAGARRRDTDGEDSRRSGKGSGESDGREDPAERAREICLRLLAVRPRTRTELAAALKQHGIAVDVAAEVLERYTEVGIIDDRAFARAWVTSRHHGRGLARRALATELRHKGVDADAVGAALADLDPDTEAATARALVERKLRSAPAGSPDSLIRRLVGMLARKGYPPGLAIRVVREVMADRAAGASATGVDLDDWAEELEAGGDGDREVDQPR
jgi:regulatory protein